ncbi:DUF3099 domain-containing protein [Microlunatus soli]|uniref:DUF3099 domain-containing protein n=1 Tax=Microlunatus soli TaxID=630515 RepID=A0A1H1N235_9ACTN|nr:DUF3099 domain-containing protein [Microlunatus soli]SDR92940.1 Protein of unknown function [Microlunatus soli]
MNTTHRIGSSTERPVITDAATAASSELRSRQIRYNITMAFRTACFVGMFFTPNPFRWVLFGAAVVLPYIAMITGSQADRRTRRYCAGGSAVDRGVEEPMSSDIRRIGAGPDQLDRYRGGGHE